MAVSDQGFENADRPNDDEVRMATGEGDRFILMYRKLGNSRYLPLRSTPADQATNICPPPASAPLSYPIPAHDGGDKMCKVYRRSETSESEKTFEIYEGNDDGGFHNDLDEDYQLEKRQVEGVGGEQTEEQYCKDSSLPKSDSRQILLGKALVDVPGGVDGEDEGIIARVKEAIAFMSALPKGQSPSVHTYFTLVNRPVSTTLELLREADRNGLAHLIARSHKAGGSERYAIGVPHAPTAHVWPAGIDPHWWIGKSRAEMKAGPGANAGNIEYTEGLINNQLKRQKEPCHNKAMKAREDNLEEAVYRQSMKMSMFGERRLSTLEDISSGSRELNTKSVEDAFANLHEDKVEDEEEDIEGLLELTQAKGEAKASMMAKEVVEDGIQYQIAHSHIGNNAREHNNGDKCAPGGD